MNIYRFSSCSRHRSITQVVSALPWETKLLEQNIYEKGFVQG